MPRSLRLLVVPGTRLPLEPLADALRDRGFVPVTQVLEPSAAPFAATDGVPTVLVVPDPPPPRRWRRPTASRGSGSTS